MNETKSYKNINLSDLGTKQKITQVASRVALFVPRLLGKLATKLVVNPITKLVSGQTYEQVKDAAVALTLEAQREQADELDEKIEEGYQNLEAWEEDREYYISNLSKYKSYRSTIEDLVKKQTRLCSSPKKIAVAKNYFVVMKAFREKHKELKAHREMVQKIVYEYQMKKQQLESKKLEVEALEQALTAARSELGNMQQEFTQFENKHGDIVSQIVDEPEYVDADIEPVVEPTTESPVNTEPNYPGDLTEYELGEIGSDVSSMVHGVEEAVQQEMPAPEFRVPAPDELSEPQLDRVTAGVPVQKVQPEMPAPEFRVPAPDELFEPQLDGLTAGVPLPTRPQEQMIFAQMANMAAMGQTPVSDNATLEAYGLSEEGAQKQK